jgi:hypothetical protein
MPTLQDDDESAQVRASHHELIRRTEPFFEAVECFRGLRAL